MVKHIVTWKLKTENKEANAQKMCDLLIALKDKIEEIVSLEVGINENGGEYDVILLTEFSDHEDLKAYDSHPEHVKVKDFIKTVVDSRIAVDYKF